MGTKTLEIKNDLHRRIVETNDEEILSQVQYYFSILTNEQDWWDSISEEEKDSIQIGINQIDQGKGIPHRDVMEKVNHLLKRD